MRAAAGKADPSVEAFWTEFEASTGEKARAFSLGRYLAGWAEFPSPLWGLVVATDGGLRFRHFAQESWIDAIARPAGGGSSRGERNLFLPRSKILSASFSGPEAGAPWWRRFFSSRGPILEVSYADGEGRVSVLLFESDEKARGVAAALSDPADPADPANPADPAGGPR